MVSKDGTYELAVSHEGERTRRRFGKDLDRALKATELMAARLAISPKPQQPLEDNVYTFRDASEDWIRVNRGRWSANTIERYSGIVRDFLEPSLGNLPAQKVDRQKVKELLVDILAIRSAKSVELTHAVISGIFTEAIDNKMVLENPAQGLMKKILPPKRKRNERAPDPLTRDDLSKVLDAARKHVDADVAMVIETLAKSGMRLGECLAMHRDHLDASNCQYMIMETVRHGRFGIPKTGKRLIDLPDDLVARLQSHILRKMTVNTYGHWIPGEGRKDLGRTLGDRMDEQVGRARRAD